MELRIRNKTRHVETYRVARVVSLFNSPRGDKFNLDVELPIEEKDWKIGLVVGPSGSGKSSIGRAFEKQGWEFYEGGGWPKTKPIIDAIAPDGSFDDVTAALSAVGLGTVPSWLRPYSVLSTGEKFRADLAKLLCEPDHDRIVFDEFTSVVNRQIAKIGAMAFSKAWKRTKERQVVLLSCHEDILPWVQPDWTYSTETGEFTWGCLQPRPRFDLEVRQTDWSYWPLFSPHHYLELGPMPAAITYIGFVDEKPVVHLGMSTANKGSKVEARACRLVVMPEWQGAGVGMKFLNHVCQLQADGDGRLPGRKVTTVFHTSHPGLAAALRRDPHWRQLSAVLHGGSKKKSASSIKRTPGKSIVGAGYGGHFRAVQGFRYFPVEP